MKLSDKPQSVVEAVKVPALLCKVDFLGSQLPVTQNCQHITPMHQWLLSLALVFYR